MDFYSQVIIISFRVMKHCMAATANFLFEMSKKADHVDSTKVFFFVVVVIVFGKESETN